MLKDRRGLPVSAASTKAVVAFDHAIEGYLGYRSDLPRRMEALLTAAPEFALAHCLRGYLAMFACRQSTLPMAQSALAEARQCIERATPRERAHVDALDAWIRGNLRRSSRIWAGILQDHPHDVL